MSKPKRTTLSERANFLADDAQWAGLVRFDQLRSMIVKTGKLPTGSPPGEWTDTDTLELRVWVEAEAPLLAGSTREWDDAVVVAANGAAFNPLQDYLNGLVWDGEPRIDFLLPWYLGTPTTEGDLLYHASVGRKFMIQAAARALDPGCKADSVLVLEGPQGCGKSTAVAILGGEWCHDSPVDMDSKDGAAVLRGAWLVELAELEGLTKSAVQRVKAFLTLTEDRYRAAYARHPATHRRSCAFIATTNDSSYLQDVTGNRRFWPVHVTQLDRDALVRDRDQLWAEAVHCYRAGVQWFLHAGEIPEFHSQQQERVVCDPWEEVLTVSWLPSRGAVPFSASDVLMHLEIDPGKRTQMDNNRVGRVLRKLGYERVKVKVDGKAQWRYRRG